MYITTVNGLAQIKESQKYQIVLLFYFSDQFRLFVIHICFVYRSSLDVLFTKSNIDFYLFMYIIKSMCEAGLEPKCIANKKRKNQGH